MVKSMTPEEAFTGVKPEVGHLWIFGCPVYVHVPKDKRMKLEPSTKKGTFMWYSEYSKAYRIYILGSRPMEVSRDVTFEEGMTVKKGIWSDMEIDDEEMLESEEIRSSPPQAQRELAEKDEPIDTIDLVETVDDPRSIAVSRKRPRWAQQTLHDAEGHEAPHGTL